MKTDEEEVIEGEIVEEDNKMSMKEYTDEVTKGAIKFLNENTWITKISKVIRITIIIVVSIKILQFLLETLLK